MCGHTKGVYPQSDRGLAIGHASKGFVDMWVHLTFAIFANFDLKKTTEMAFDQDLTCFIFPFRWACFPIKIGRNAQWVHLFLMDFDDFLTIYLIFDGKSISQWEHHIPSIKGCDATSIEYCFISMIISVDTLCGFAPSPRK